MKLGIALIVLGLVCSPAAAAWNPGHFLRILGLKPSTERINAAETPSSDASAPEPHDEVLPGYPGWPGPTPDPSGGGGDPLPFTTGMIINLESHATATFCNVAGSIDDPSTMDDPDQAVLRCDQGLAASAAQGLLVMGKDYTTDKIMDGGVIMLKSQKIDKFCTVGPAETGYLVTCNDFFTSPATEFIVKRSKARADLFWFEPVLLPGHRCYPARSRDHHDVLTAEADGASTDDVDRRGRKESHHEIRCDGHHHGDNALFSITQAQWYAPPVGPTPTPQANKQGSSKSSGMGYPGYPGPKQATYMKPHYPGPHFPSYPGGPKATFAYPSWPGGPGGPAPPSGDVLPFTTGSNVQLIAPKMRDRVCDIKEASWVPAWAVASPFDARKKKKTNDDMVVQCDRRPPEGPGSEWKPAGFGVLAEDPAARALVSGAPIHLSSQSVRKYCSPDKKGVVTCEAAKHDKDTIFRVYLTRTGRATDSPSFLSRVWALATSWLHTGSDSGATTDKELKVYLLHEASNRYCGPDPDSDHADLVCDFGHRRRPKLIIKVKSAWP